MYSRNIYLLKNIGLLALSSFSSRLLLFILIPVYTSFLTTQEVGIYDLVLSTATVLCPILTCNISAGVMRFFLDHFVSKQKVATVGFRFLFLGFLLSFIIVLICREFSSTVSKYAVYIFLLTSLFMLNQFLIEFAKGLESVYSIAVASFLGAVSLLIGTVFFLKYLKLALDGFFLASIISQALSALSFIILLKVYSFIKFKDILGIRKSNAASSVSTSTPLSSVILSDDEKSEHEESAFSLQHQMLAFSLPSITIAVGWWINSTAGRYLVAMILGVGANGILSVSYKIPQIVNLIHTVFIQAWQISAVKEYSSNDSSFYYGRMFILNSFVLNIAGALTILFLKPICSLVFSESFCDARLYIPYLIVSVIINSVAGFLGPILSAKKNSKAMAVSAIWGIVTNLLFSLVLICFVGIQGACLAAVISSFSIFVVRKKKTESDMIISNPWIVYITWLLLLTEASIEIFTDWIFIESCIVILICGLNYKEFILVIHKTVEFCSISYLKLKVLFNFKR